MCRIISSCIFDLIGTLIIIYYCFRKEESQLHSLNLVEFAKEVFDEIVVTKPVVFTFDNKRSVRPPEFLLDVVEDGDSKDTHYKTSDNILNSPSTFHPG